MTTLPDLLYVALCTLAVPVIDYLIFGPAFRRLSRPIRDGHAGGSAHPRSVITGCS